MSDPSKYTIGWICAITIEYNAAQVILDETHDPPERTAENDNNTYTLGRINKHNVVIAILPQGQYGLSSAAAVARDLIHSFPNVRIGLMVGIGGGAPTPEVDIRLGDVVVSSPRDERGGVYQYDFGKSVQDRVFRTTGFLNQPPTALLTAVNSFKAEIQRKGTRLDEAINEALVDEPRLRRLCARPSAETDQLFRSDVVFDSSRSDADIQPEMLVQRPDRDEHDDNPAVHYGLIASANQLMKDAVIRDKFAAEEGVLCFEMEAAGLMNHFPCLVIRGICDYSDSHKNKRWQGYAAMTAAAYAKELVCRVQQNRLESEQKLSLLLPGLRNMELQISTLEERTDVTKFDKLLVVEAAIYNTHHDQHEPKCHPGTRLGVMDGIWDWAEDPDDQDIYWLSGIAGTGKSTISRTVAQEFDKNHLLAGTFFFKRGDADRNKASLLFSTIARQLVEHRPDISPFLEAEIRDCSNISSKNIQEQFRRLIHQPLQNSYKENFKRAYFAACGLASGEELADNPDKWTRDHDIALNACNNAIAEALVISHGRSKRCLSPSISPVPSVQILEGVNMEKTAYEEVHEATYLQAAKTARLEAENTKSLILIIDAIDECATEKDVELVVPLLSEIAKSKVYNLKVFATSRPELPIRYAFGTIEGTYQEVRLHEISEDIVAFDIKNFLEHELEQIRRRWNTKTKNRSQIPRQLDQDWPGNDRIESLVKIADRLFIFASTACRFIGDPFSSPEKQLSMIIDGFVASAQSPVRDRLAPTYLPVLWQFKDDRSGPEQADLLRKFQDVVGTLILLEEALSVNTIASLLDIEPVEVDQIIDPLSSAIDIPEDSDAPVKPFHLSFRDFLLGPSAGDFSIPFRKTHQNIALSCLDLLSRRRPLYSNIYKQDLRGGFTVKDTVSEQFPPHVAYACLHWNYHVEKAELCLKDGDEVHQFLQAHLLHWLEAIIYLKLHRKVPKNMNLERLIEGVKSPGKSQLFDLLQEAKWLDSKMKPVESWDRYGWPNAPCLQVHWFILAFAPMKSILRRTFLEGISNFVSFHTPKIFCSGPTDAKVTSRKQRSESSSSEEESSWCEGTTACFSHTSTRETYIVSIHTTGTLRIWSSETGELVRELDGFGEGCMPSDVVLSPDMQYISITTVDGDRRILHAIKPGRIFNVPQPVLPEEYNLKSGHGPWSAAFSPDSTCVAVCSRHEFSIWTVQGQKLYQSFPFTGFPMAFSKDWRTSAFVVRSPRPGTPEVLNRIRVLSLYTGQSTDFGETSEPITALAVSPNSALVASSTLELGTKRSKLSIWVVHEQSEKVLREGMEGRILRMVFSHASEDLATVGTNGEVRVWSVYSGRCRCRIFPDRGWIRDIVFSPDDSSLLTEHGEILIARPKASTSKAMNPADAVHGATWKGYGIDGSGNWLTWNGKKLVVLPSDARKRFQTFRVSEREIAVTESFVAWINISGQLKILGVSPNLNPFDLQFN